MDGADRRHSPRGKHGPAIYYPGSGRAWEKQAPAEVGMDARLLDEAIAYACAHESQTPLDMAVAIELDNAGEPHSEIIGPTYPRAGGVNGLVLRHGYIIAEWGDTWRSDMTFSATKSYLSTVAGLALDRGLIEDVDDAVRAYMPTEHFDSPHNAGITWRQLLNHTSDWQGTLWGKPDWADRPEGNPWEWHRRILHEPGSRWKYNDVRVNMLALALLHVWRRPLPQVLKEGIMDPIGASQSWRWHGYRDSWAVIDGLQMQSVSGGGHWGGGLWISCRDHARFGYLCLRRGRWLDRQLISERWIRTAITPTPVKQTYGYMNWLLNTNRKLLPSAPETSYYHAGGVGDGLHAIWVDPEHNLVAVLRWLQMEHLDAVVGRILAAVCA